MSDRYLAGMSGYLPLLRLDRAVAAKALRFAGLGGRGVGHRAVAGWDEDALTMAVEAARLIAPSSTDSLIFASTSAPFYERNHATLALEALALSPATRTNDVAGSRRCGVSALLDALLGNGDALVVAGERRPAKAGSAQHLSFGDGGAAALVSGKGGAKLIGHASMSHDFIDSYASRERPTPYVYEERFVKDVATPAIIVPTIKAALANAGVAAHRVTFAAVHEPLAGCWRDIAKRTGIAAPNLASDLTQAAGDLGAAHPIYALALACAQAKVGDIIMVAGFGSGCDALVLEMTGDMPGAADAAAALTKGVVLTDYVRFLSLTNTLDLDFGVRGEFNQKAQATVLERYVRDMHGFIGGRDSTGNVQFPKSKIPVNPAADSTVPLSDVRLADDTARIVSITADRLNYTPDPPFWFGLVQFENGARVMMEFADDDGTPFKVGDAVQMRFRIKAQDKLRGFRTYFWKGVPAERPALEGK